MKIIEAGNVGEVWTIQHRCTGHGNGANGCKALLQIELRDLRYFEQQEYPWRIQPEAVCFKCPCCGHVTDLEKKFWPVGHTHLNKWTSGWHKAPVQQVVDIY